MTKTTKRTGLRMTSGVKAGGLASIQHNRRALRVRGV